MSGIFVQLSGKYLDLNLVNRIVMKTIEKTPKKVE